jgi:putative hydrolase of the HAD superfamily
MNNIQYIIFDIDGVLAKATDSAEEILVKNNITMKDFFNNWSYSKAVYGFETGQILQGHFAELRSKELENVINPETIIEILKARKSILFQGVEELLADLHKENYRLACLSNTNILHWNSIEGKSVFDVYFCNKFLSFEMGLVKPDKAIYMHVLEKLNCKGHEILYFDDSIKNIEVAKKLGWNAILVEDFYDLTRKINYILKSKI